jgi:hypothetical protein
MKAVVGALAACAGVFVAFLLQQALPEIHVLHGARFVFVPMIFCYAAMALPFPAMLFAAFFTGLFSDLMYLNVVGGRVEIALGCSIVFFVIYGSIANGLRPSFLRGQWWPLIPLSVLCTWSFLIMQFTMISLRRGEFVFEEAILWRAFAPGLLAGLLAPLLYAVVKPFGALVPDNPWHTTSY